MKPMALFLVGCVAVGAFAVGFVYGAVEAAYGFLHRGEDGSEE